MRLGEPVRLVLVLGLAIILVPGCLARSGKGTIQGAVTGQGAGALGGVRVFLLKNSANPSRAPTRDPTSAAALNSFT